MTIDTKKIRDSFQIFKDKNPPIYLDNACVSFKPDQVITKMNEYYFQYPSCHKRGVHSLAEKTSEETDKARINIAHYIGAKNSNEIIFTKNTTEAINLVALGLDLKENDCILTSDLEHNSNLIPWLNLERTKKIKLKKIAISPNDEEINLEEFERILKNNPVKLVSFFHQSHITGMEIPLKKMIDLAHKYGALFMLDAAQSMMTNEINVKDLNLDFLAFSFHKIFGPSGMGMLYGKIELLDNLEPIFLGGQTVIDVFENKFILEKIPNRFEPGLQNYSGIIGANESIKFLKSIGPANIKRHNQELNLLMTNEIAELKKVKVLGPKNSKLRNSILTITAEDANITEMAMMLDRSYRIMARSGVHCSHYWFNKYELTPSLRFSFTAYNTLEEVKAAAHTLKSISKILIG